MAFIDFQQINTAVQSIKTPMFVRTINALSSSLNQLLTSVQSTIGEYSRLYAQNQWLKYDSAGNISDVTPASRESIPESAIAQLKQSVAYLKETIKWYETIPETFQISALTNDAVMAPLPYKLEGRLYLPVQPSALVATNSSNWAATIVDDYLITADIREDGLYDAYIGVKVAATHSTQSYNPAQRYVKVTINSQGIVMTDTAEVKEKRIASGTFPTHLIWDELDSQPSMNLTSGSPLNIATIMSKILGESSYKQFTYLSTDDAASLLLSNRLYILDGQSSKETIATASISDVVKYVTQQYQSLISKIENL